MGLTKKKPSPSCAAAILAGVVLVAVLFFGQEQLRPMQDQILNGAEETAAPQPTLIQAVTTQVPDGQTAFRIFFTNPDALDQPEGITELSASIDQAQKSVRIAMYNFSLDPVGDALLAAFRRGVAVQMVMETGSMDGKWAQKLQSAGIEVVGDGREGLMHNKFVVIDDQEVWTGSWNLTGSGTYNDHNNLVQIRSPEVAANYTTEFQEMFRDGAFGPDGRSDTPYPKLTLDGRQVEFYFSPEDRPAARIVELVRGAQDSVEILAYSFTLDDLGDALKEKQAEGLTVRIVCDQDQVSGQGAECPLLQQAGLDVRLDGLDGLMHHKVILIDHQIVIFGSFNFTRSANEKNDENLVVVFDTGMAQLFQSEFERIYTRARE